MKEKNYGERFKAIRLGRDFSQKEVEERIGITKKLSHYELNSYRPPYEILFKMADVYDVTIDYLLGHNSPLTEKDQQIYNHIIECYSEGLRVARRPYGK